MNGPLRALMLGAAVLTAGVALTQTHTSRKSVRADFANYWDAVRRQDAEAVLAALDPRMFELVSRERLADGLRRSAADTTVRVTTGPAEEIQVSGPFEAGKVRFAGVSFGYNMRMVLADEPGTNEQLKDAFLLEMLEKEYGKGNVVLDQADGAFEIRTRRQVVAVLNEGEVTWHFLDQGKEMKGLNGLLVPAPMLARLFP